MQFKDFLGFTEKIPLNNGKIFEFFIQNLKLRWPLKFKIEKTVNFKIDMNVKI